MKITATSRDGQQDRIMQRDPAEALRELHDCIAAVNASMQALAAMYPGCTILTGFDSGQPCSTLALARAADGDHFTAGALDSAKALAKIAAALPSGLAYQFEIEVRQAREAEEEKTAALAAAAEKRSE